MRLLEWVKRQQARVKWLWEEDCLHPISVTAKNYTPLELKLLGPDHFVPRVSDHHYVLVHGPAVSSMSWMAINEGAFTWGDHGYYPVYRIPELLAWRVVWPLPLWVLHVMGHWAFVGFVTLYQWHWLYHTVPLMKKPRIRDLRPCLPHNWKRPPR